VAVAAGASWHRYASSGHFASDLRAVVVHELEQGLHRDVAVGGVSGSLIAGVVLRDLRIAERGGFAEGVAFSSEEVRLSINWRSLLEPPPGAVWGILQADLLHPQLALSRNAGGAWNVHDLLGTHGPPSPGRLRGRVLVHDGRVEFRDAASPPGSVFAAAFDRINGEIDVQGGEVAIALTGWTRDAEAIRLSGRYRPGAGPSTFDLVVANGAVARWGPYFVHLPQLGWARGRFAATVHFTLVESIEPTLDYTAALRLHGTDVEYRPRHLWLRDISGPLTADNRHAETTGLLSHADGSPLGVNGTLVFAGGLWMELRVRSPALDLATVQSVFFPQARLALTGQAGAEIQVTGPVAALGIDGEITGASGRLNGVDFADLQARLQYAAGTVMLTGLRSSVAGGQLSGDLVLAASGGTPSYLFSGTTSGVDVDALAFAGLRGLTAVRGRVSGHVVGVGTGSRAQLMGDVTLGSGTVRGVPVDRMHAIFWEGDSGVVDLDYFGGGIAGATVYGSGRIGADGALDLDLVAHDLSFADLGPRGGPGHAPLGGHADLVGHATGTVAAPVFSGTVTATHGRVGPIAFAQAQGSLTAAGAGVTALHLDLLNGGARYRVSGGLAFDPIGATNLQIEAEDVDARWVTDALASAPDLTGTLSGTLTIDGPLPRATVAGRVVLQHGTAGGQRIDHAEIHLAPESGRLRISDAEAQINGARVFASGTIDASGALDLVGGAQEVQLADLAATLGVPVAAQGTLALSGEMHGTLQEPRVSGTISAPDIEVGGQAFTASGAMDYERGVLRLSDLELAQGASRYRLSGVVRPGASPYARLALDVEGGRVATVLGVAGLKPPAPLDGALDGRIEFTGPLDDPTAHLTLHLGDAHFGAYAIGDGIADLTLAHQRIDIERFEIYPAQGQVAAKGRVDLRGVSEVEVSAQDLNPDFLRPFFRLDRPLEGRLNFTAQLTGPLTDPRAGVSLEAFDAGVSGAQADRIAALAFYSAGTLHIEQGLISKGPHTLVAAGTLPVDRKTFTLDPRSPLHLQLRLQDADLSFLSLLTPRIVDATGTVAGEVDIAGTIEVPQMTGFLRSAGGRLRYTPLRTPLEDIRVDVEFSQDQIQVHDLSAALGQGRVRADGVVEITNFHLGKVKVALRADHATADLPGLYTGQVDAELAITGEASGPTLSGTTVLSNGLVSPGGAAGTGGMPDLVLNVGLEAGQNTVFTLGAIRAQVQGGLNVGGTLQDPLLRGDVTSSEGEVAFLGSTFRLTAAEAVFTDALRLDPQISAQVQRVVGDTIVYLDFCGLATELRVCRATSIPPHTETDIYALLATDAGITGDPESVIGQGLGRSLLGSVREALHLSEFTVAYSRESPVTLRIGTFLLQNVYLTLSEVWPGPPGSTIVSPLTLGTLSRPQLLTGQAYSVAGIEYFLSPNLFATFNVDTLGGAGFFLQTQFPL